MPDIYVCFVWHMHQPFYKDLVTGEYHLPWTRMHALKDYYGMVHILEQFPEVHQTFNLVPSMVEQIDEYAAGKAVDPFLRHALKPAEELNEEEQAFILRYFFQAHPTRMIQRYPRYGEIHDAWLAADRDLRRVRHLFTSQTFRDLQVLSQLAWFDEEFIERDPEVGRLIAKGRGYTIDDQALMGRKQLEIIGHVLPVYAAFAQSGQIEVTTTPFYHPILPLLCDSNVAGISHPYVPLPPQFRYPADARHQIRTAREYVERRFGAKPVGMWPSEGSVSDDALGIAAEEGFEWAASDNGVLSRTLGQTAGPMQTYRPYRWVNGGRELKLIFRDHYLSDLIGFVYSRMDAVDSASHFIQQIRENAAPILQQGRDALVPIILDGENAWEHYEASGRAFLKEMYRRITLDPQLHALTVSEALERVDAQPLGSVFPGSWINANFDVWIGAEEDNRAWEFLLRAREAYEHAVRHTNLPEENRRLAFEELLIAEGSDWCWWYGPEHYSENRVEFDRLYRAHLANVYRALKVNPPEELSRPILRVAAAPQHLPPTAPVRPKIDGDITSYFEWMGAGVFTVDARSGAMHGHRFLLRQLLYGSDRQNLFLRLDFEHAIAGLRIHLNFGASKWWLDVPSQSPAPPLEVAYAKVLEIKIPLSALDARGGDTVRLQLSLWEGALPVDALPQHGWLELSTADPSDWPL